MNVRAVLATKGLRHTNGRGQVLHVRENQRRPLTHAEVAERIPEGALDLASVYRNLVKLTDAGLVSRIECGDRRWRYELQGDAHAHFLCVGCGAVACLREAVGPASSACLGQPGGEVGEVLDVLVRGRCRACLEGDA